MAGSESSSHSVTVIGAAIDESWMVAVRLALFVMRSRLNPIPGDRRPEVLQAGR
jgi:hypothetical protein